MFGSNPARNVVMNEELLDIEGKNKIPEDKKGNINQEVLTLEEIEKFLQEINTSTIVEYNSSDERNQPIDSFDIIENK